MTSELRVDKIVPTSGVPTDGGGGIVQMKQAFKTDTQSHNTATRVDISGLSITITPKFSTSKLWITGMVAIGHAADTCCNIFINANGSLIGGSNTANGGALSSQPQDVHTGIGYNYVGNYEKYRIIPAAIDLFKMNTVLLRSASIIGIPYIGLPSFSFASGLTTSLAPITIQTSTVSITGFTSSGS